MTPRSRVLYLLAAGIDAGVAAKSIARSGRRLDLAGSVVLITGGSRGLGLLLAREFAARDARLAVTARDHDELQRSREALAPVANVFATACDVRDRVPVEAIIGAVREQIGRIDVLVNSAGVIQQGSLCDLTGGDFDEETGVHFWGPLHVSLAVLPQMRTGSHKNAMFTGKHRAEYTTFSLMDAALLLSMDAQVAARQAVDACVAGEPEIVLGLPAQAAAAIHGLLPGVTAELFGIAERLLPEPGDIGAARATGAESETPLTQSPLTTNIRLAAAANNETGAASQA